MLRKLTMTIALVATSALPLPAQVRVGLSAYGGGFVPANDLFESVRLGGPDGQIVLNLGLEPGPLVGGRVTLRRSRLSVEAEAGYAFTHLDIPAVLVEAGETDGASTFLGSVNLLYDIFQAAFSPLSVHVSVGLGLVARGGDFLDRFESTSDLAVALGTGVRYGLGPTTFLRLDLRDYISSFAPRTRSGFEFASQTQHDLVGTIGVEFSLAPIR